MYTSAKLLYIKTQKLHKELYTHLIELRKDTEGEVCTDEVELTDASFCLRECISLLEDVRKELSKTSNQVKERACYIYAKKQMASLNGQPIRTVYCTATPDVKMYAPFPIKKSKDGWDELMEYLGVSKETADKELVRPHYNSMVALCTELTREGKPLPPGCNPDNKIPQYDLKMKKTGVAIA